MQANFLKKLKEVKPNLKTYTMLYGIFFMYSFIGVSSKTAVQHGFFTFYFFVFYGISLSGLVIYAFLWQKILKKVHLTRAYPYKAVTIGLGMLWGMLFFNEPFRWNVIVSMVVVAVGIHVLMGADE